MGAPIASIPFTRTSLCGSSRPAHLLGVAGDAMPVGLHPRPFAAGWLTSLCGR